MKSFFCLYPHCLVRRNQDTVIAYNTQNHRHVLSQEVIVVNAFGGNSNCIEITVDLQYCNFFLKCVECGIGYYIESNHFPFISTPSIKYVTSIEKEKQALGYLSFTHSSQMLKEVTILTINSINKGFSQSTYNIINDPAYPGITTNACDYIERIKGFCSLRTIIISGDYDYACTKAILRQVNNPSISLLIRTYADFYSEVTVNDIIITHQNVQFEFLFDKTLDKTKLEEIKCNKYYNERVFLNVLIEDISTLYDIATDETIDFIITPIFNNNVADENLKEELYLSKDDILNGHLSMKDILVNESVNTSCFGSVVVKSNGDVVCRDQTLGNIKSFDLIYLINRWASNPINCNWFNTRQRRTKCSECIYNFLCPPISVYEDLGIIDNACGNNINSI